MVDPFTALSALSTTLSLSNKAKVALEKIKDAEILDWVQNLRTYIIDLKEDIIRYREENLLLKEQLKGLENKLTDQNNYSSDGMRYWHIGTDGKKNGPFCQPCFDQGSKMRLVNYGSSYYCKVCDRAYGSPNSREDECY